MKYSVATFQIDLDEEKNVFIRKYVVLEKNLTFEEAKKTRKDNKHSWTYRQ